MMRALWRDLLVHVGLFGVLVVGAPAWASALWDPVTEVEGMQVARRLLPGTGRYEVRVSTAAPFPPQVIFETLWRHHEYPDFVPYLKHLTILKQAPNEKVIYEQIRMPLVRDRDYTVKVTAERDPATGRMQITFVSAPEDGPPAQDGYVRVTAIHGSWTLVPTRDGGTLVTYVVSSDPGGALPAWLVNRAQRQAAPALVKAMLDRVKYNLAHIAERRQRETQLQWEMVTTREVPICSMQRSKRRGGEETGESWCFSPSLPLRLP